MAEIKLLRHSDDLHSSSINGDKKVISSAAPETDAYAYVLSEAPLDYNALMLVICKSLPLHEAHKQTHLPRLHVQGGTMRLRLRELCNISFLRKFDHVTKRTWKSRPFH